jgi:hypothetical protein
LLRLSNVIAHRRDGKQVFYSLKGRSGGNGRAGALEVGMGAFSVRVARAAGA